MGGLELKKIKNKLQQTLYYTAKLLFIFQLRKIQKKKKVYWSTHNPHAIQDLLFFFSSSVVATTFKAGASLQTCWKLQNLSQEKSTHIHIMLKYNIHEMC